MVMPSMFVITRWLSKYKMLSSLFQNKPSIVAMCASPDEECASLHDVGVALTGNEWNIIEVRWALFPISLLFIFPCMQEALPLFQKLANISRHMEGEKYILSSSYWGALREIESALQPQAADSPILTSLRAAMYHDHFTNRVTLNISMKFLSMFWCIFLIPGTIFLFSSGIHLLSFGHHYFLSV